MSCLFVFRVRLSCPLRKTEQKFRDQAKSNSSICIPSYVITAGFCNPDICYYWQPTWPNITWSNPVFLLGCFVAVFFFLNEIISFQQKKQNYSYTIFCWFVPLFHFGLHMPMSQTISNLVSFGKLRKSCVKKMVESTFAFDTLFRLPGSNLTDQIHQTLLSLWFKKILILLMSKSRLVF